MLISRKIYNFIIISTIVAGGWYTAENPEVILFERNIINTDFSFFSKDTTDGVNPNNFTSDLGRAVSKVFSTTTKKTFEKQILIDPLGIVESTNNQRLIQNISPLSVSESLNKSAQSKLEDMISRQYFEHDSPDGKGVSDLASESGYSFVIVGENLALGDFLSSEDMVQAWMDSPGHRANILSTKYREIGVAVKEAEFEGKTVWIGVQHFGSPRSSCPEIDESLRDIINRLNESLRATEGDIRALRVILEAPGANSRENYQDDVSRFNEMVDAYNVELARSRSLIVEYNNQVRSFNSCIATFQ